MLNERTLNAYISEAIRQELAERKMPGQRFFMARPFVDDNLRYRVDFKALNELVNGPENIGFSTGVNAVGDKADSGLNLPRVLQTSKARLERGTFGDEGFFMHRGKVHAPGHIGQRQRVRNSFIAVLRNMGYSNQQIHDAIVESMTNFNGPIYLGTNETGQQFIPFKNEDTGKKRRKRNELKDAWQDLWDNVDDAIHHPELYPDDARGFNMRKFQKNLRKGKDIVQNGSEKGMGIITKGWNWTKDKINQGLEYIDAKGGGNNNGNENGSGGKQDGYIKPSQDDYNRNWNDLSRINNGRGESVRGSTVSNFMRQAVSAPKATSVPDKTYEPGRTGVPATSNKDMERGVRYPSDTESMANDNSAAPENENLPGAVKDSEDTAKK